MHLRITAWDFSDVGVVEGVEGDGLVTISYVLPASLAAAFQRETTPVLDRLYRTIITVDFDLRAWDSAEYSRRTTATTAATRALGSSRRSPRTTSSPSHGSSTTGRTPAGAWSPGSCWPPAAGSTPRPRRTGRLHGGAPVSVPSDRGSASSDRACAVLDRRSRDDPTRTRPAAQPGSWRRRGATRARGSTPRRPRHSGRSPLMPQRPPIQVCQLSAIGDFVTPRVDRTGPLAVPL